MPVVPANRIEIACDDRGGPNDPVIQLIIGLATQIIAWPCDGLAARGFRVIRFDNRDVGPSTKSESAPPIDLAAIMQSATAGRKIITPYDLTDMAKDAVGLIDRLSIGKAHVVGASMGGMVGHIVAGQYRERVRSLVSVMSSSGEPKLPQAKLEAMSAITQPRRSASNRRSRQAHGRAIPGSKLTIISGTRYPNRPHS